MINISKVSRLDTDFESFRLETETCIFQSVWKQHSTGYPTNCSSSSFTLDLCLWKMFWRVSGRLLFPLLKRKYKYPIVLPKISIIQYNYCVSKQAKFLGDNYIIMRQRIIKGMKWDRYKTLYRCLTNAVQDIDDNNLQQLSLSFCWPLRNALDDCQI